MKSAAAARDHVAALRAAGIGLRRLSALSGVSRSALSCLVNGRSERGSGPSWRLGATTAATARKVATLFAELEATPGPSQRAKNDGARRGWEPPVAWDERDINHFTPTTESTGHSAAEPTVLERYAELRFLGYSDQQIADREGIAVASLHVRLTRARVALASGTTMSATHTLGSPRQSILCELLLPCECH